MTSRFLNNLLDEASRPFRGGGRFADHRARGTPSSDCVFRKLPQRGIVPAEVRLLDLGCGQVDVGRADVVTILDALHYIDHAHQKAVLQRIRTALPAGGLFLTRVGDAGAGLPYHLCTWLDHAVTFVRGHRLPALYGRRLSEWVDLLTQLGFDVETMPMSAGKPFANVMLISRLPAGKRH